ncbi:MAG TPA: primosomal protein N' [bacterium]|nr:primosomal protein N' [bacterium]HPQ18706.1 primosomal protein N' [bacterium]
MENYQNNSNQYYALVVIFSLKINEPYYYSITSKSEKFIGCRVIVEVKTRLYIGFIIKIIDEINDNKINKKKIKPIVEILDTEKPFLNNELINLGLWMSQYYFTPLGIVFNSLLIGGINFKLIKLYKIINQEELEKSINKKIEKKIYLTKEIKKLIKNEKKLKEIINKGIIKIDYKLKIPKITNKYFEIKLKNPKLVKTEKQKKFVNWLTENKNRIITVEIAKKEFHTTTAFIKNLIKNDIIILEEFSKEKVYYEEKKDFGKEEIKFTEEQEYAFETIKKSIEKNEYQSYLLFGVTASGKTEIYVRLIKEVIRKNKKAILLVPEIILTPQTLHYLCNYFKKERIAILHSKISNKERIYYWEKIKNGEIDIVIGVRSAIFVPLENIGIIIVDEEHESTYKNQEMPTYNARDIAVMRAKNNNGVAVLGSATPSIESYYNAITGKYKLLKLKHRVFNQLMPEISIIDLSKKTKFEIEKVFSYELLELMKEVLKKDKQVLLFLNRRGYSNFVMCPKCKYIFKCINCDISLTYHKTTEQLVCHYCNYSIQKAEVCPNCKNENLFNIGSGTEKIERYIKEKFYNKNILRVDLDTMQYKNAYEELYKKLKKKEVDIVIGTQIITKGHNFPDIALVGILNADISLNIPDYKSSERTFELIMQTSGRTGRTKEEAGKVIIQTFNPEHYSIESVLNYDYDKFYNTELEIRKNFKYPPFVKLMLIEFKGRNAERVKSEITKLKKKITESKIKDKVIILGPAKSVIYKISNNYYYRMLIKTDEIKYLRMIYKNFIAPAKYYSKIRIEI